MPPPPVPRASYARLGKNVFLRYHQEVRARIPGFRAYKAMDEACIEDVFRRLVRSRLRGAPFLCRAIHELTWGQCLPNANHRTTLLFAEAYARSLRVRLPREPRRYRATVTTWMVRGKPLIEDKDWLAAASSKQEHKALTCAWLGKELGRQSGRVARMGARSLMSFLSQAESGRSVTGCLRRGTRRT